MNHLARVGHDVSVSGHMHYINDTKKCNNYIKLYKIACIVLFLLI